MTETALALKEQLLALPLDDQLELYRVLEESVCPQDPYADMDDEAWAAELDRRFEEIESGQAVGRPAKEMFDELRKRYS
ncbi:MAG TPA: addiction module protein [Pirellulaceae bacterium]|jgi:putative addiction module component (TIGR02574 family)